MAFTTASGRKTWSCTHGSSRGAKRIVAARKNGRLSSWHGGYLRLATHIAGADTMAETEDATIAIPGPRLLWGTSPQVGEMPGARVAGTAPIKFSDHPLLSHDAQANPQLLLHLFVLLSRRFRRKQCQYGYHDLSRGSRVVACCPERLVDHPGEAAVPQRGLAMMRSYRAQFSRVDTYRVQQHYCFHLTLAAKQVRDFGFVV